MKFSYDLHFVDSQQHENIMEIWIVPHFVPAHYQKYGIKLDKDVEAVYLRDVHTDAPYCYRYDGNYWSSFAKLRDVVNKKAQEVIAEVLHKTVENYKIDSTIVELPF